jgi:hypothetical protein
MATAEKDAACRADSGNAARLKCTYMVAASDNDGNGISVERNELSLPSGAAIRDLFFNIAKIGRSMCDDIGEII